MRDRPIGAVDLRPQRVWFVVLLARLEEQLVQRAGDRIAGATTGDHRASSIERGTTPTIWGRVSTPPTVFRPVSARILVDAADSRLTRGRRAVRTSRCGRDHRRE